MPGIIYILAAATCLLCTVLLLRAYANQRSRLLLWSGICFAGLMLENIILFLDMVVIHDIDLSIVRTTIGLGSLSLLVFGMVWESK
jgi:hypothetical protein